MAALPSSGLSSISSSTTSSITSSAPPSSTSSSTSSLSTTSSTSSSTTSSSTSSSTSSISSTSSSTSSSVSASDSSSASTTSSVSATSSPSQTSSSGTTSPSSTLPTSSAPTSTQDTSTHFVTKTVTDGSGRTHTETSAVASGGANGSGHSGGGTNVGAIVGGVIGGLAALALLALLLFFCLRRRRNRQPAFDEKTFDPTRHSTADPLDLLDPSVPDMAVAGQGARVDPFPYQPNPLPSNETGGWGAPETTNMVYDPYSHAPMQMPDARDYMTGYGNGLDGGYGVAAGVAAGAGAGYGAAVAGEHRRTSSGHSIHSPVSQSSGPSSAALAKQREAQAERQRLHMTTYDTPGGSGTAETGPDGVNRRASQALSEGRSTVYQHTDMASMPDDDEGGQSEIPPEYHSIPRT
ncbi:hypothetical protein TREMEDRAFT_74010 [Tremella mesenterica DSM 1558]|uniref:uncharacterized protein n=1 Tax=Tremella mesenterica (strain ATCC 24925 / CBS 8224 / DSM 1558 / NBRC 9311 / NRRL Y-6157 / RJB 2259-6 / UBC 559-6) TaxID=578456 RepID=UPI0003F49120|nr:uncharacterized protein TREMEDRAFT_74010 [Tremella mesenterica DSM 1558]EIW69053.1 hypothetical protein TREMEDRAFT_74010 [Tremella mesenterica DSM 1558]